MPRMPALSDVDGCSNYFLDRCFVCVLQALITAPLLLQDELGEMCVTAVVSFDPNEAGGHVHFEAYQAR